MSMPAPPRPVPARAARRFEAMREGRRVPVPGLRRNASSMAPRCTNPNCSAGDVVEDDGKLICRSCGFVVSDAQITQELTFGEAANGAAVVQGVYVGAGEENARNPGLGPSKITGGMDSRQVTERNGQQAINNLVAALQLSATQKDRAMRLYKLAMSHNFIQGRKTVEVAAVCLYIACRQDAECRIMLIDFSDLLKRNVFDIGKVYNAFLEELNINGTVLNLQQVNPENLIQRFAQDLEFGADEHRIANEAVHILKRLDRDWITPGRRPAGVCAAAIILAARMNNYRRTVREVVYTAKVCDLTIHKRLDEFRYTDSSKLTVDEFRNHAETLSKLHDPPAFYRQFEPKKKRRKTNKGADAVEEDNAAASGPDAGVPTTTEATEAALQTQNQGIPIDPVLYGEVSTEHLAALAQAERGEDPDRDDEDDEDEGDEGDEGDEEGARPTEPGRRGRKKGSKNKPLPVMPESEKDDEVAIEQEIEDYLQNPSNEAMAAEAHRDLEGEVGEPASGPSQKALGKRPEVAVAPASISSAIPDTEIISDSEFPDDPELENAILSKEEVAIKERIWVHENGEYLRIQQARKLKQELALAAGTARVPKRRARKKHHRLGDLTPYQTLDENGQSTAPASPAESVKRMLSHRGYSKRLDYSKIDELFGKRASPSTAATSTRAGSEVSDISAMSHSSAFGESSRRGTSLATTVGGGSVPPVVKGTGPAPIVIEDGGDEEESDVESLDDDYVGGSDEGSGGEEEEEEEEEDEEEV